MKFETLAAPNPIDRLSVVGKPHDRVEGRLKTTGTATYAYEYHGAASNAAYGYVVCSDFQGTDEVHRYRRCKGWPGCHRRAAGRILNPKTARSQVIGGMTMGIGAALMEDMVVDTRFGFFVNHDLAGYEVPVHADVPHLDVIFIDELDPTMSPLQAKGVGELGLTGVAAAVANAVYNATGVRVREYPITLDKFLAALPVVT